MRDWIWFFVTVAIMIGMVVVAFRIEPHWSSKDGMRFICRAQPISLDGTSTGAKWREVRGEVRPEGIVKLRTRGLISGRKVTGDWRLEGRGITDRRQRVVYILRSADTIDNDPGAASRSLLALRMPGSSRAKPVLDDLVP